MENIFILKIILEIKILMVTLRLFKFIHMKLDIA